MNDSSIMKNFCVIVFINKKLNVNIKDKILEDISLRSGGAIAISHWCPLKVNHYCLTRNKV